VPVEEAELLLPVRRVVRGIEVDRNQSGLAAESPGMMTDDDLGQFGSQTKEVFARSGVFEARERGLRSKRVAVDRVTIEDQLVNRVVSQMSGVVAVSVSTRHTIDTLPQKVMNGVFDHVGIALVEDASCQTLTQPQSGIDTFDQDRTAVRAAVVLVERGKDRLGKEIRKKNSLCARVSHRRALGSVWNLCQYKFLYAA
jgi:hypothetical protein